MSEPIVVDFRGLSQKIAMLTGSLNPKQFTRAVGLVFLRWIDQNFKSQGTEKKWAPLKPSTIAGRRKGKGSGTAQTLQDTGRLKQSFSILKDDGSSVTVGTNLFYAKFHHVGTSPYEIRPKQSRVLRFMTPNGFRFARKVNHPGLPSRPLIPSDALAKEIAIAAVNKIIDAKLKRQGSGNL